MAVSIGERASVAARLLERAGPISDTDFEHLYRHYKPRLVHFARRSSDPEGIADLALLDGYRVMNRFQDRREATYFAYLKRAALSHMLDERARRGATIEAIEDDVATSDPAEALLDRVWVADLLSHLSPDQRAVIELRFLDDLDGAQTGALLEKDPNAIYQLQHRALKRLRRMILAAALVVLAIIGVVVGRQLVSSELGIDTTPADRLEPAPVVVSTVAEPTIDREGSRGAPGDDAPTAGGEGPPPTGGTNPTEQDLADQGPAPTTSAPDDTSSPSTTSTVADGTTTLTDTTSPSDLFVWSAPNRCEVQPITATLSGFIFFDPEGHPLITSRYEPLIAVRFVDGTGRILHVVDATGPMTTGLSAGGHGWIGVGDTSGTHATYGEAPPPARWGVLVNAADIEGWATIDYRIDGSTDWWDVACP